jgi:DNA-binding response OmpR family regulator
LAKTLFVQHVVSSAFDSMPNEVSHMRDWKSILLVSNDDAIASMMLGRIEEGGWQITVHRYSLRTLVVYRDDPSRFDLIIVDENVDDMIGATLAERLLRINGTVRIILLLAKANGETESKVRAAGVFGLLTKPVSPEELIEAAEEALGDTDAIASVECKKPRERSRWLRKALKVAEFRLQGLSERTDPVHQWPIGDS